MISYKKLLATTTALTLLPAGALLAQAAPQACTDLEQMVAQLPDPLPEGMTMTRDEIVVVVQNGDEQQCATTLQTVAQMTGTQGGQTQAEGQPAEGQPAEGEQVVDQAETTVTLEDQKVVRGVVYLDRAQPTIDLDVGQSEVMITPSQPSVTVNEGQAEIVIREKPATITLEMPQPTIRIDQPAPEIIITMPEPGVDVTSAQPQVEVRQAEPTVTVSQAAPTVELELEVVEEGQEGGFEINDRATGQTYRQGEAMEAAPVEDAELRMTQAEPVVTMQGGEQQAEVQINRSEPTVRFENAEPQVQVTQGGEPQVEFTRSGEPTVSFQQAQAGQSGAGASGQPQQLADTPQTPSAGASDTAATETPPAGSETPAPDAASTDTAATTTPPAETGTATTDATTTPPPAAGTATVGNTAVDPMVDPNRPAAPQGFTYTEASEMTAEQLTGAPLFSSNEERIGEVGQAILSPEGRITHLVVEVGGFLGIGERDVALEFDRVRIMRSDAGGDLRGYVDMTKEELEQMPEYEG